MLQITGNTAHAVSLSHTWVCTAWSRFGQQRLQATVSEVRGRGLFHTQPSGCKMVYLCVKQKGGSQVALIRLSKHLSRKKWFPGSAAYQLHCPFAGLDHSFESKTLSDPQVLCVKRKSCNVGAWNTWGHFISWDVSCWLQRQSGWLDTCRWCVLEKISPALITRWRL